jgi:hypothetical protein
MASSSAVKRKLSGSTDGMDILITTITTPGNLIHTAVAGTTPGTFDEVFLWAANTSPTPVTITIEFGDNAHGVPVVIPGGYIGDLAIKPGKILQNSATVKVFASVPNVVFVGGYINAIID